MIKITDGNAFILRVQGITRNGDYEAEVDLSQIDSMTANFVRRGRSTQESSFDSSGRLLISNEGTLDKGVYGVEMVGYYNGQPWRSYAKNVFEIVNANVDADDSDATMNDVPIYDVTIAVTLGGSGVTADFVDAMIAKHSDDETSHPYLIEKIEDAGKVDDVLVNGQSVVDNKEANIQVPTTVAELSDANNYATKNYVDAQVATAGHVDDVKVNGQSVVSNKEANIDIPTTVAELEDAADYATNEGVEEALAAKQEAITEASVEYTEDGGSPDASVEFEDGVMTFQMKNMKMKFSELTVAERAAIKGGKGDKGEQGDSAVFDPNTGNILATLRNTTGDDDANAMTQKAVSDEVWRIDKAMGEFDTMASENLAKVNCCLYETTWLWKTSGQYLKMQKHSVIPVVPGDVLLVKPTADNLQNGLCAWLTDDYVSPPTSGSAVPYAPGTANIMIPVGVESILVAPEGAAWFCMNRANINANETSWRVYKKDAATNKLTVKKVDSISSFSGCVDYQSGEIVTLASPNAYNRLFQIDDPSKVYYADLRTFPDTNYNPSGVAYFDGNDTHICSQYFGNGLTLNLFMVRLCVPENAAYCYIIGNDGSDSSKAYPQLYVADEIKQASKPTKHLVEVGGISFPGNGNTNVMAELTCTKPNRLYVIKADYDSWTMPDPTASTTAFRIDDTISSSSHPIQKTYTQNNFVAFDELRFITRQDSKGIRIALKALAGELIKLTIYEVSEDADAEIPVKAVAETGGFLYNTVKVKGIILDNGENSSEEVEQTEIDSAWAVAFPESYTQSGKPTQVIAMLHGSVGYVSPSCMGYTTDKWVAWRNLYLSRGFAVMDINGWGISSQSDGKSRHWACPPALETIDKAFDSLKAKYNVCDKLILHGSSMGGATAWAYGLTRPNKVLAMGLFSPATLSWIMLVDHRITDNYTVAIADWQYADAAAAISDDFRRIVGYDPIIRALRYHNGLMEPIETLAGHDVLQYAAPDCEYKLVGQPLAFPVRIWHGDQDPTVNYELSEIVTDAYRTGGQNVSLRCCPGKDHAICTGGTTYVCNEAVAFFEMFSDK